MFICEGECRMITMLEHNYINEIPFQRIVISQTIIEIKGSFYECYNWQCITTDRENLHFCDIDDILFYRGSNTL